MAKVPLPPIDKTTTTNFLLAKKTVAEQTARLYFRENKIDFWYSVAAKYMKEWKLPNSRYISREEALRLAALQLQVTMGDHNPELHKSGLIPENNLPMYIQSNFRKDIPFEADMYKEHAKLVGMSVKEAKRHYIDLARILKRLNENVFYCYLYSADKMEAREILLVVGEDIFIFDANTQEKIIEFSIALLTSCYDQHTTTVERERLRKQIGHISHLHQIVLDIKTTVLRILASDRGLLRRRFDSSFELFNQSNKEREAAENQDQNPSRNSTSTVSLKYLFEPEMFLGWLLQNPGAGSVGSTLMDIYVRIFPNKIWIVNAFSEELINEIQVDWIKSWRQEIIPENIAQLVSEKMKSGSVNVYQLYIDLGKLQSPLRIITVDKAALRNKISAMIPENSGAMEEYYCEFLISADNVVPPETGTAQTAILKFYNDILLLRNPETGDSLLEVPFSCVNNYDFKPLSPELIGKFRKGTENFLIINIALSKYPILIASYELSNVVTELKKLLAKSEIYRSSLANKTVQENPLNGKLYNGLALTKKLTISVKNNSLDFFSTEDKVLHRDIPTDQVSGWTVIIKSIGNDVPVILTSVPPKTKNNLETIKEFTSIIYTSSNSISDRSKGNDSGSETEVPEPE